MSNSYEKPLNDDEFVELGELLAAMPEPFEPMEPDYMDGFLTALLCLPDEPSPGDWMPYIFDSQARQDAALADPDEQDRLEELTRRLRAAAPSIRSSTRSRTTAAVPCGAPTAWPPSFRSPSASPK